MFYVLFETGKETYTVTEYKYKKDVINHVMVSNQPLSKFHFIQGESMDVTLECRTPENSTLKIVK